MLVRVEMRDQGRLVVGGGWRVCVQHVFKKRVVAAECQNSNHNSNRKFYIKVPYGASLMAGKGIGIGGRN